MFSETIINNNSNTRLDFMEIIIMEIYRFVKIYSLKIIKIGVCIENKNHENFMFVKINSLKIKASCLWRLTL